MNDRFYTNELSEIRSFCNHSDKEDIYMYIYSLQQENQRLKEELKYTVPIVEHNKIVSKKLKENQKYKEVIDKAIELLGNYKHYSTPDEKQNSDNEDLVNNAFDILKEVSE